MLHDYFTRGTERTVTGAKIGIEVETDFVDERGVPIKAVVTNALLLAEGGRPPQCTQKLELGRQKIELAIEPCANAQQAIETTHESLQWLYGVAAKQGAHPFFGPEIGNDRSDLLYIQEERDGVWIELDGQAALEHLCRCSSIQFTIDVNPRDTIALINRLWTAHAHQIDYIENNARWRAYIAWSKAGYRSDRYGGPEGFEDLRDYVAQLEQHHAVMHRGQPCNQPLASLKNPDIDLFLRSVWWHYRLRRYSDTLTLEIRPFARRNDATIAKRLAQVLNTLGL